MNREEFTITYNVKKGKLVGVLTDKMVEEKLKILRTFLDESNIMYDHTINDYKKLVNYLKRNLTGKEKEEVLERCKQINDSVDRVIEELSKGSTTAFSRFADTVKRLIKPIALGLAANTLIQLAPGGPIVRLTFFGVSLLYNGYRIIKTNLTNKEYMKEVNLDKYLRNLELTFMGNELTDTRFDSDTQRRIRDYLRRNNIPFNDTGYQSLREVVYSLGFEQKFDLVCELTDKRGKERDSFLSNLKNQRKVEDFDKEKNKLIEFLKRNSGTSLKAALSTGTPFLVAAVNGLIAKEMMPDSLKPLGNIAGITTAIGTLANSNKFLVGVESYLLLSVLGNIGKFLINIFRNLKNRKIEKGLFQDYVRIENQKYSSDDEIENRQILANYQNQIKNGTPNIIVEIVIEYLKYIGVDVSQAPKTVDGLSRFIKSDKLNNKQRNKVRSFLKEMEYYNKHKNNKFVRKLEKVLKATGAITVLGLAGLSVYDLLSGHTFFNELYQKLYFEKGDFTTFEVTETNEWQNYDEHDPKVIEEINKWISEHSTANDTIDRGFDLDTGTYQVTVFKYQKGQEVTTVLEPLLERIRSIWPKGKGHLSVDQVMNMNDVDLSFVEGSIKGFNNETLENLRVTVNAMANGAKAANGETRHLELIESTISKMLELRAQDRIAANQLGMSALAINAGVGLYDETRQKAKR